MNVHGSTACHPGITHAQALARLQAGTHEPLFGTVGLAHCQLCPQNSGVLDVEVLRALQAQAPDTRLRLHANVRVFPTLYPHAAADFTAATRFYFVRVGELSRLINAPCYSLHAGRRAHSTLDQLRARLLELAELLQLTVAVEGLYPTEGAHWLIASWAEYRWLLESGLPYALDLSHLAIVAQSERCQDAGLLHELLSAPQCCEIHLSANDGRRDLHRPLTQPPWWWPALTRAAPHSRAVIFTEGSQRSRAAHTAAAPAGTAAPTVTEVSA
jgi:hypothetical protein